MQLILRLVLMLVIVRAIWMLVRGVLEGMETGSHPAPPPSVQLVRDPICGVYLVPSKALTASRGTGTAYFCSEKCRQQWQRRG
jgi:YHS domain-containing protein